MIDSLQELVNFFFSFPHFFFLSKMARITLIDFSIFIVSKESQISVEKPGQSTLMNTQVGWNFILIFFLTKIFIHLNLE